MQMAPQSNMKARVDVRGLVQFLHHFDLSPNPQAHLFLYSTPFLVEPASWCITALLYAKSNNPHWFFAPPVIQRQALAIRTRTVECWHIVPVPREKMGIKAVTRDILLTLSQSPSFQMHEAVPVVVHEVTDRVQDGLYGCFLVEQGLQQWSIGLHEDEDGPYYHLLSGGETHVPNV